VNQQISKHLKTKICSQCKIEETTLYRIQNQKGKIWIFVCEACCIKSKALPDYKYGGTWKGYRH
jgi:RNase P subunit RPR2